ncbi:hypothetical protein JXI42_02700, partial [bacterium]|nr:hypothetical protein [bacterium]
KVLKFLRITPFAKVDVYIDDMEEVLYPCDPKVCTLLIPPEPKDINKWRGTFSTGVDISIPLYLRH